MLKLEPSQSEAKRLSELLRSEFLRIPLEHWGFFFPGAVALWRFVQESRPDLLGQLSGGFDKEPWFQGRGSRWFTSIFLEAPGVIEHLAVLMRYAVSRVPPLAWERGFLYERELSEFQNGSVEALIAAVAAALRSHDAV